jgi:hypothetical protein
MVSAVKAARMTSRFVVPLIVVVVVAFIAAVVPRRERFAADPVAEAGGGGLFGGYGMSFTGVTQQLQAMNHNIAGIRGVLKELVDSSLGRNVE